MKIEYYDKEIAPLAWLADITAGIAKVTCGNHVEKQDNFFVAGAWSGDFSDAAFCNAEWFCGTGGGVMQRSTRNINTNTYHIGSVSV